MFELSILGKYLIPRRGQLSMTLIALMSVTVISLVVWLIVLFLSVTDGIEKNWLEKLTSLHAPVRITPTKEYFSSYHYLIDTISQKAHYTPRTLAEKIAEGDLYNPSIDEAIPAFWPPSQTPDPVKVAHEILSSLNLKFQDFEMSGAMLRLQLTRPSPSGGFTHQFLSQASYLASFPDQSPKISQLLLDGVPLTLPVLDSKERGVVIAKQLKDSGVRIGDRGWLSYPAATAGALQEQRLPIFVAGFYDPGVLSVGNKCILAPADVVHLINTTSQVEHFDKTASIGFSIWLSDIKSSQTVAAQLEQKFKEAKIDSYWNITTYHQFDFAKDLLQQFQSDRYLFTLIGLVILLVACSNIISLLVILVSDKKKEIGILQALGASRKSIAVIFGGVGAFLGLISGIIGIGAALLTLHHLDTLIKLLSLIQGHAAFNAAFYGNSLPHTLSYPALVFVLIVTPLLSLMAGLIPAWKACRMSPAAILRSE